MATNESGGTPEQEVDQYHTGRESWFTEGSERPAAPEDGGPQRTIHEPARETPVYEETDVLVAGGGPAGCAAAVAARRLGAKVTLVERYNHLGGLSTGGLVIWIDRMSDWEGRQIITGFASEILERLPADAVAGAPQEQWGSKEAEQVAHWRERLSAFRDVVTWSPMIDPEWLKYESVELLEEVGARLILHAWVVDAIVDGRELRGAIFESKEGRRAILAKVVVDTTGDLDVCAAAGAAYESDVEGQGANVQHCVNTAWTWAGIDFAAWVAWKRANPEAHRALFKRGNEELGYLETPHAGWRDDVGLFMGPRLTGYSGLKVADLTAVEIESRRRMTAHLEFFRRHAPGFQDAWLMLSGPQLGVRHTRRLVGHAQDGHGRVARGRPPRGRDRRLPLPLGQVRQHLGPLRVHRPGRARQRPRRRSPRRHRSADPGLHARDPAVLAHRAGRGRRGRAVGGQRHGAARARRARAPARAAPPGRLPADRGGPGRGMTYVIGAACIGTTDRSCVDVCPVDCIHEVAQMLVIDPGECIDCSLCEPACPVSAITPGEGVAPDERAFIEINAAWPDGAEAVDRLVEAYQAGS